MTNDIKSNHLSNTRIGFTGAGNMARSIIGGLVNQGHPADRIWVSSRGVERATALQQDFGIQLCANNQDLVDQVDVTVIAVKPQQIDDVMSELIYPPQQLLVSVAAGITTKQLQTLTNASQPIVRSMPNTPASIGQAATGLYANAEVRSQYQSLVDYLFSSIGQSVWLEDEQLMDCVTAIAGSAPAYYFAFMEALIDAAVAAGMQVDAAELLVKQTALGATSLAIDHPSLADLRKAVTSPGGTTQAALQQFSDDGLNAMVGRAVSAAIERGKALSRGD